MDQDTKTDTKGNINDTVNGSKDTSKSDASTNGTSKKNGKKEVSFKESSNSSKDHRQDETAIDIGNTTDPNKNADNFKSERKQSEGNPSTYRSSDEEDDMFTVFVVFFSWILILLTFPISIFSCFKMVQVKE